MQFIVCLMHNSWSPQSPKLPHPFLSIRSGQGFNFSWEAVLQSSTRPDNWGNLLSHTDSIPLQAPEASALTWIGTTGRRLPWQAGVGIGGTWRLEGSCVSPRRVQAEATSSVRGFVVITTSLNNPGEKILRHWLSSLKFSYNFFPFFF